MCFMNDDDSFDAEGSRASGDGRVHGPGRSLSATPTTRTEKIADTTRRVPGARPRLRDPRSAAHGPGRPYDSDEGRAIAAAITALMTGAAYVTSARTAARMGPFAGFHENAGPMLDVLRMHRREVAKIDEELVSTELLCAAQEAWDTAVDLAEAYGVRNAQATVLAPRARSRSSWIATRPG